MVLQPHGRILWKINVNENRSVGQVVQMEIYLMFQEAVDHFDQTQTPYQWKFGQCQSVIAPFDMFTPQLKILVWLNPQRLFCK
jgi:hypothetical protein